MMFLGSLLDEALNINPNYALEAKTVLEEAVKISSTKQIVSFELAQFYVATGQTAAALDVLYKAWKLDTSYRVAAVHTWVLAIAVNRPEIAAEVAAMYPPASLSEPDLLRLGESYRRGQIFPGALLMYAELAKQVPDNAKYHVTYAALLANAGRFEEARMEAQTALKLDPSLANDVQGFLQRLNAQ